MTEELQNSEIEWSPPQNISETEKIIVATRTGCPDMRGALELALEVAGASTSSPEKATHQDMQVLYEFSPEVIEYCYDQIYTNMAKFEFRTEGDSYPKHLTPEDWEIIKQARADLENSRKTS